MHVQELQCIFSINRQNRFNFGVDLGDYNFTWLSNCVILNLVFSCSILEGITLTFKQPRISCGQTDLTSLQGWDFYYLKKFSHERRRTVKKNSSSSASLKLNEKNTGNSTLRNGHTFLDWKDNLVVEFNCGKKSGQ